MLNKNEMKMKMKKLSSSFPWSSLCTEEEFGIDRRKADE
jgi:hypothetical protein